MEFGINLAPIVNQSLLTTPMIPKEIISILKKSLRMYVKGIKLKTNIVLLSSLRYSNLQLRLRRKKEFTKYALWVLNKMQFDSQE